MGLGEIFGALLLGTWAALLLSGLVLSEAVKYFTLFPDDPWSRKGLVILTLTFGIAAVIGDCANTYLPLVTYYGNAEAIQKVYWPLPLYSIANQLLAIIVDCYLIYRFYSLSKNIWATISLYGILLLALAGYLVGFVPLVRGSSLADRDEARIGAMITFISMVVCDLLIAAGLVWNLRSMKSSFAHTNTFIKRVMVGAIQTGSATSVCSLLLLITFLKNPESNVPTFFIFLFAPLYTLTLLFNFNIRRSAAADLVRKSKTSESRGGGNNILMDGIHVHRTVVTMSGADGAARSRTDEGNTIKLDPDA
ncbi:hypothetical protein MVEN_00713600 [Mycena venus]|uniref:DUF6534 domain-containing protein n=1 Tax=Mycena venus TaxID=2733690 RepID=A0A8H6YEW6_9AGAR|nr:hypothetical protein MVEN_00713600 [Mycena venus]